MKEVSQLMVTVLVFGPRKEGDFRTFTELGSSLYVFPFLEFDLFSSTY